MRFYLLAGIFLIFMAIWRGDGGILDLHEYLDDAERLWLKGDLSLPQMRPDGQPAYNRYSLGLPFLSGPLVIIGNIVDSITNHAVNRRQIAALIVPFFGAGACLLLFEVGRMLSCSGRASFWAALMLGLGSPLLTFVRYYYAEAAVLFLLLLGVLAFLKARPALGAVRYRWLALTGFATIGATACHYGSAHLAGALWIGIAASVLTGYPHGTQERLRAVSTLIAGPIVVGAAILYVNSMHFGHPFRTGYSEYAADKFSVENLAANWRFAVFFWVRTPWLIMAFYFCHKLWSRDRAVAASIFAGVIAQEVFWLSFVDLYMFWMRYQLAMVACAAAGLPFLGDRFRVLWPRRGLTYSAIGIISLNVLLVLGHDGAQPFTRDPVSNALRFDTWYAGPSNTSAGIVQWMTLSLLILAGSTLLVITHRKLPPP